MKLSKCGEGLIIEIEGLNKKEILEGVGLHIENGYVIAEDVEGNKNVLLEDVMAIVSDCNGGIKLVTDVSQIEGEGSD